MKVETGLRTILKLGIGLTLLIPFIVSNSTFFPYIYGKGLFFQVLIEILAPIWLALILFYPKYRRTTTATKTTVTDTIK